MPRDATNVPLVGAGGYSCLVRNALGGVARRERETDCDAGRAV